MKTLKDFTPEIQAKIPEYIKNATKGIFNGERYNNFKLENAEKYVIKARNIFHRYSKKEKTLF